VTKESEKGSGPIGVNMDGEFDRYTASTNMLLYCRLLTHRHRR
jgi:hypothetical protein